MDFSAGPEEYDGSEHLCDLEAFVWMDASIPPGTYIGIEKL